jgi:hypothetical protein
MPDINLTPVDLANTLQDYTDKDLQQFDHALLYQAREYAPKDEQNRLAEAEHRAFAREATAENPLMAVPISLATLLYQPYKMLAGKSRSDSGLNQVAAGLGGVKEGLAKALKL